MNIEVQKLSTEAKRTTRESHVKSIDSKHKAMSQGVIYVYCPLDREKDIGMLVQEYDLDMVINDYSVKNPGEVVICHYDSTRLDDWQKSFLVRMTSDGCWVEPLVSYLDSRYGYTEVQLLQSNYFLHQKAFSILSTKRTQLAKRFVDVLASLLLMLIAIPVGLIAAVAIKLESKGPVFYRQKRVGQFNIEFDVIKFRSMSTDAEKGGAQWAQKNDCRVTKVGYFIRKTRIDELPQIINIFKGEMSLIGPRPEREVFVNELEKVIPYYRFRNSVKPGVTGLAQVSYPYGASIEDAIWKHKYDIFYIKHHSTWLDIKILFKTIKVVLLGAGR